MFNMSKRTRSALLWAGCFAALFLYMYLRHGYAFPFIEQNRMFMWDGGWILRRAAECGGAAAVARDFLLQFFVEPWSGALLAALLLTLTAVAVVPLKTKVPWTVRLNSGSSLALYTTSVLLPEVLLEPRVWGSVTT